MDREFGGAQDVVHLPVDADKHDLAHVERLVGDESLRGRTGGAVTLAVGMSLVLSDALDWANDPRAVAGLMKYWYHFAIMFEALFILTTIDAGTRIARFLLQEIAGQDLNPQFGQTGLAAGRDRWRPAWSTAGWGYSDLHRLDRHDLADVRHRQPAAGRDRPGVVTTLLVNTGRGRYASVTLPADAVRAVHDADRGVPDGDVSIPDAY